MQGHGRQLGCDLAAELAARFPGEVPDLAVNRPTLEDVYLRMIGERA